VAKVPSVGKKYLQLKNESSMQGGAFRKIRDPPDDTDEWKGGPKCMGCMYESVCFFIAKILQNFDLKNMILTDTKDFSWEKWYRFAKF
jgi:hypothetical protein